MVAHLESMSLTLLLHQWQGHQGPRFARHMASRVSTNCELSAHSEFVAFGVTAPRLFRRVTTVPSAFDVYPIEGSVIDRRLTRATTFAPTRQGQVNQLPIGSVPVPCLPLIHRRTNISLGFRVRGARQVRPLQVSMTPAPNPSFRIFIATQPAHIQRTMLHTKTMSCCRLLPLGSRREDQLSAERTAA